MIPNYPMDPMFQQSSWQPQMMPMTNLELPNNFNNFNLKTWEDREDTLCDVPNDHYNFINKSHIYFVVNLK
jgi:hypothetical protein